MHEDAWNTEGERPVEFNKYQERVWEFWKNDLVKKFRGVKCLILNGDLCELMQPRNRMTETWSSDPIDQAVNVARLIDMLKPKITYIVRGTPYHIKDGGLHVEELVGRTLSEGFDGKESENEKFQDLKISRITKCPKQFGRYAPQHRLINLAPPHAEPRVFHVTHHMPTTGVWQYRGTGPSKSTATLMLNESHFIDRKIWNRISGIIRGHVHHYWYEESANRYMLVSPAWQFQTPFMAQKAPENIPDIGFVSIICHKDGHVDHRKYFLDTRVTHLPVSEPFTWVKNAY